MIEAEVGTSLMSERFTETLRAASEPGWSDAVGHRFVKELFAGAVPDAVMARYLVQDHRFLDSFLTLLGAALASADTFEARLRFVEAVETGMKEIVSRIRAKIPGVRIIGATLTSALGSTNANHGSPEEDAKRKALNEFIRTGGLFDGVADFDAATIDPETGGMRAAFVPGVKAIA
jgi:hypothetical protein